MDARSYVAPDLVTTGSRIGFFVTGSQRLTGNVASGRGGRHTIANPCKGGLEKKVEWEDFRSEALTKKINKKRKEKRKCKSILQRILMECGM